MYKLPLIDVYTSCYSASSGTMSRQKHPAEGAFILHAGRAALTDNFDACRDLSGRRMRHVNADKKLAEWAAQARERELEKVAAKLVRDQERAALQEAEQQVLGAHSSTCRYFHCYLTCDVWERSLRP